MQLGDSQQEREFRALVRSWLRVNVGPQSLPPRAWSDAELRTWSKSLSEAGFVGLTWPVEYGGRGLPPTFQTIYAEESARAGAPDHLNVIGLNMVGPAIMRYGTAEQKATYLPGILSGELVFCQGFSEPDAGSDLAAVRTRASSVPGGYQLAGEKVWSSYAHLADHCLLLARTDPEAPRHRGLSCFLLDLRMPGVRVRPLRQMSGGSTFNQIILRHPVTPADTMLGAPGDGWQVAMTTLAHERGTFGTALIARLAARFDLLLRTVEAAGATGDPLVRRDIAELDVLLHGLRFTGYRVLAQLERTGEPGPQAAILKLRWSQAEQRLTELATRILAPAPAGPGSAGSWLDYWQRERLNAAGTSIEGGTSEILRGVVAERVLGLPRSR